LILDENHVAQAPQPRNDAKVLEKYQKDLHQDTAEECRLDGWDDIPMHAIHQGSYCEIAKEWPWLTAATDQSATKNEHRDCDPVREEPLPDHESLITHDLELR
jgi:hypothetical protein